MKIYYWPLYARASHTLLLLEWTEYKYELVTPDWPGTLKAETPFGQMPYVVDGDVKVRCCMMGKIFYALQIAQSNAIARYVARKVNMQGDNDKDFAMSEMLIEEAADIYNIIVKCQYVKEGRAEAWQKCIKEDLPAHFANLEKLLNGPQFCSKVLSGDLAIYSVRRNTKDDIATHTLFFLLVLLDHLYYPQEH